MTDLCLASVNSAALAQFVPVPVDLVRQRCVDLTRHVDQQRYTTLGPPGSWPRSSEAWTKLTHTELLRVLASVLEQDRREPGWFLRLCEEGVIADILQAIELREAGYCL
jgi:hypothetical protein